MITHHIKQSYFRFFCNNISRCATKAIKVTPRVPRVSGPHVQPYPTQLATILLIFRSSTHPHLVTPLITTQQYMLGVTPPPGPAPPVPSDPARRCRGSPHVCRSAVAARCWQDRAAAAAAAAQRSQAASPAETTDTQRHCHRYTAPGDCRWAGDWGPGRWGRYIPAAADDAQGRQMLWSSLLLAVLVRSMPCLSVLGFMILYIYIALHMCRIQDRCLNLSIKSPSNIVSCHRWAGCNRQPMSIRLQIQCKRVSMCRQQQHLSLYHLPHPFPANKYTYGVKTTDIKSQSLMSENAGYEPYKETFVVVVAGLGRVAVRPDSPTIQGDTPPPPRSTHQRQAEAGARPVDLLQRLPQHVGHRRDQVGGREQRRRAGGAPVAGRSRVGRQLQRQLVQTRPVEHVCTAAADGGDLRPGNGRGDVAGPPSGHRICPLGTVKSICKSILQYVKHRHDDEQKKEEDQTVVE